MALDVQEPAPKPEGPGRLGGWPASIGLGLVALALYLANGREIGTYDTEPTTLLPLAILRGDGPHLDRFRAVLREPDGRIPDYVTRVNGHIVSLYPIATALLAVPVYWPQVALLDRVEPGWDRNIGRAWWECHRMAKRTAALIAALVAVALHRLLRGMGLVAVATTATLAAALGSDLWMIASQALWQHGPAALALTLALGLLLPKDPSAWRLVLAGLAAGSMVAFRALDLPFAAAIALGIAWNDPRRLAWFLPGPIVIATALIGSNLYYFGAIEGGQARLEALHPGLHHVAGPWAGNLLGGMAGTLLSPSRGLLIFTPWVVPALATTPAVLGRLRPWPIVRWALGALVVNLLILSKYAVWWGGYCFGPRYWTEAIPLLAILLALGLDWARSRSRKLLLLYRLTIAAAILVQVVGAACYPSSWNLAPESVDRHHERLWDWYDSELKRCLREGPKWPSRGYSL